MPETEQSLITAAADGSMVAFEQLYRLHSARVYGLCMRLCGSVADAQDATQETFIKAWKSLSGFRGNSAFSTWLHKIAFNESISLKRKRPSDDRHLHVVEQEAVASAASLTELEQMEHALATVPDRAREALVLHKIYGYTHEEVGEFMGISIGASKAQVHRAIKLLRARFPDEHSGDRGGPWTAKEAISHD